MADEKLNEELQIPIEWDYDKFKNSAEFKDIKRNKKGQFVPNNEQLRLLVKYEEIKLSEIDTSEITDMSNLFCGDTELATEIKNNIGNPRREDFSGISEWDTSRVTTFKEMFFNARNFNEDISGWDTSSAKSFNRMFVGASSFNNFNKPLKWDTSSVTNMRGMFKGAKIFNQSIGEWNTSKVTDMSYMFWDAQGFNQSLDKWDTSSVTNMNSMFKNTKNFNQDLSAWGDKLGRVQDMSEMFSGTKALNLDFLNSWVISSECDTAYMTKERGVSWDELKDSYEVRHIKRNKKGQFVPKNKQLRMLVKYEEVKLSDIDTGEVTSMTLLFRNRKDFSGISEWDTSKVKNFNAMFAGARFNADIGGWDTSSAQSFFRMFAGAENFNQNINSWNVSNVSDFSYMFWEAKNFNQPLDKWNVSNAVMLNEMFAGALNFEQNLSAWGDKLDNKLQDMRDMFEGISEEKLKKIKYKSWNVPENCIVIDPRYKRDDKQEIKSLNDEFERLQIKKGDIKEQLRKFNEELNDEELENRAEQIINEDKNRLLKDQEFYEKTYPQNVEQMRELEKTLKTPKTKVSFVGLNVDISVLENEKTYKDEWKNEAFFDDRKWIPKNIKEQFKVFLEKKEGKKGEVDEWDIAYCEAFGLCFKIEKYKSTDEKGEKKKGVGDFHLIQGYEMGDFRDFGINEESEFVDFDEATSICFAAQDVYIWHKMSIEKDRLRQDNRTFNIALAMMLAQGYYHKMIEFGEKARKSEKTRKETKELQECHKAVCNFDLKSYSNVPILQKHDYKFLRKLWEQISTIYGVSETYKELKEAIMQMSQLLTDYKRDRQSWWFSLAAVLIALVSLLVAVVSALPVVEKLLE